MGAFANDDGGTDRGAVWILFMKSSINLQNSLRGTSANALEYLNLAVREDV